MVLVWHSITWEESYIGKKGANVYITTVFLMCCLLFFMALPRIYTRLQYRENPSRYPMIMTEGGPDLEFVFLRVLNIFGYIAIYLYLFWPLLERVTGRHLLEPLIAMWRGAKWLSECWGDPSKGCW